MACSAVMSQEAALTPHGQVCCRPGQPRKTHHPPHPPPPGPQERLGAAGSVAGLFGAGQGQRGGLGRARGVLARHGLDQLLRHRGRAQALPAPRAGPRSGPRPGPWVSALGALSKARPHFSACRVGDGPTSGAVLTQRGRAAVGLACVGPEPVPTGPRPAGCERQGHQQPRTPCWAERWARGPGSSAPPPGPALGPRHPWVPRLAACCHHPEAQDLQDLGTRPGDSAPGSARTGKAHLLQELGAPPCGTGTA